MDELRKQLAAALDREHPGPCGNACDVGKAVACGYYLMAARLLGAATDCPETDKAAVALSQALGAVYEEELERERHLLLAEQHVPCLACGAICWVEGRDERCGACGADLRLQG